MSSQASQEASQRPASEPIPLSELVVEGAERLLGLSVLLPDGSVYGKVEDLFFARDLTVSHAVVKRQDGFLVKVPAERLLFTGQELVLLRPKQAMLSEAAQLALRAAERLVEALTARDRAQLQLLIEGAKSSLQLALKALEEVELP
jgi:hypothetical protein